LLDQQNKAIQEDTERKVRSLLFASEVQSRSLPQAGAAIGEGIITESQVQAMLKSHRDELEQGRITELSKEQLRSKELVDQMQAQQKDLASLKKVEDMLAEHKKDFVSQKSLQELLDGRPVTAATTASSSVSEERIQEFIDQNQKGTEEQKKELKDMRDTLQQQLAAQSTHQGISEDRVRELLDSHQPGAGAGAVGSTSSALAVRTADMNEAQLQEYLDRHKTNCREMVLLHLSGQPQAHLGQLPTSPGPFSASQQARSLVQDKAVWQAGQYDALAAIPDAGLEGQLTHKDVERKLVARVIAGQPDHKVSNLSTVEVHDMVNSVVKEIVGVFESLLDRLLIEKKQDTLRVLVAELLTEDLATTIASGREMLKKQEMGHLVDELGRLREDFYAQRLEWEQKFKLAHELSASQDDMWAAMEEKHRDHSGRINVVETEYVKVTELDTRLKVFAEELAELRVHAMGNQQRHEETAERVEAYKAYGDRTYCLRPELDKIVDELSAAIASKTDKLEQGLSDLRSVIATEERVGKLEVAHEQRLKTLMAELGKEKTELERLGTQVGKDQKFAVETYAIKMEVIEGLTKLDSDRAQLSTTLRDQIERVEAVAATKQVVEEQQKTTVQDISSLQQKDRDQDALHGALQTNFTRLEEKAANELATRDFATNIAESEARRVASECDEKDMIEKLRTEFDEERERLRQTIRQLQSTRKDLTDAQELVHTVKAHSGEVEKTCGSLNQEFKVLREQEGQHFQKQLDAVAEQRQQHNDIEVQHNVLKEELRSHVEFQRAEGKKLREDSTQRYLEQIDKALSLNNSVGKLELGHKELKDTVVRLPQVTK